MEDAEITLCLGTDFSPEEERYMHIEEARLLRDAAGEGETAMGCHSWARKSESSEGHAVVVEEPHSPTSQGTQEGVPEYNNEPGPDENTTQRFLEVGNYKESDATQLPEEVESQEWENIQNSGTGGGFSPVREHKKEEGDGTEDFKKEDRKILQLTDAGLPQETEEMIVEPAVEGSGQKDETFSSSMRTRIGQLEEEFESHVGATEETPKKTEEQDGTEELLVDFETHEDLVEPKKLQEVTGIDGRNFENP
ncbi:unnamed protein product [Pleuronectes platessa]|uniref:Uncharacterized protein n=1 Tax=Pleuronectes platessa TaxID=8262 RepID=A0A9N7YPY0_PLEPL|nr:unnamed protein product [Pleuronectes platessa]